MKPIILTEEIVSEVCGHIRIGVDLDTSLSACGFFTEQIIKIRENLLSQEEAVYKEFYECIKKAEAQFEVMQLMKLNADPSSGGTKWLLERSKPEKWGTSGQKAEKSDSDGSKKIMALSEVVEYSGRSMRAVQYNIKQKKLKQNPDGSFYRENVDFWLKSTGKKGITPENSSLTSVRKRYTQAQAARAELKLSIERGDYLRTDICMILWGDMIRGCRAKLLTLPIKYSPLLMGMKTIDEIKDKLEFGIYEALNELAEIDLRALIIQKGAQETPGSEPTSADKKNLSASHKTKSKRVGRPRKAVKPGKQRGARKMVQ